MEKEITLEAEKKYSICTCGKSKVIPFCDNTHRELNEKTGCSYKSLKITPKKKIIITLSSSNWEDKEEN
ncbi:MAG: CDGSH iron-sulfur domain-containing protein [Candidatus Nanoarchaeia archaeon]|jgi:CDGSH-type Zn-finger protein|nr:CDGSH iron-sulfur domain-containing protein [Candidatus Nanoarchaeia archaeon]|tara:strand:+ start:42340 stop:42546 length:207 start_codon:yes stop_codon:yes gene_type:complete